MGVTGCLRSKTGVLGIFHKLTESEHGFTESEARMTENARSFAWRLPRVEEETGLKKTSIYDLMARREFPRPFHIGARAVAWSSDEVRDWLRSRMAARESI